MRVGVLGAAGRMGATVCAAVAATTDLQLVSAIDPGGVGRRVATLTAGLESSELVVEADLQALIGAGAEAVVDFTVADAAMANMTWCAAHAIHAVCGTTGLTPEQLERLAEDFAPPNAAHAVVAPNFAISAVLLIRLCELVAPFFDGIEIIELHHAQKRDAPSGTALETARRMGAARFGSEVPPLVADPTTDTVLDGARGGVSGDGIHVHSVRLPGLVAHQEVLFGTTGQSLTIRQDSYDRVSFMPGVLVALRAVADRPGLTVGLEPLLDI